ncbi:MAG: phosphatidylglycerol lysyltransferase domain-containing protein, partial [Gemmatimonadales bacterium]
MGEDRPGLSRFWPLVAAGLFVAAMAVLHRELSAYTLRDIMHHAGRIPGSRLGRAIGLTALSYAVLPGYDAIALSYARHSLPLSRTVFGSFIAYAFSQTLGFPLLSGGSIRYRLWSSWGLTTGEIARGVGFVAFSFTLGMLATSGVVLLLEPSGTASLLGLPLASLRPLGALNLAIVAGYLAWSAWGRRPLAFRGWQIPVPPPRLAALQLVVAGLDWTLSGAVLYALLPPGHPIGFLSFLGIYLIAQFAGLLSHVPGGLGVLESILVLLLRPYLPASALLGSLVVFRAVYYLLPFAVGVVLLGAYELRHYGAQAAGVARTMGGWIPRLLPQVIAGAVFVTGAILLFSGATPSAHGRLAWLGELLPLGVIELSHFLGSLAGVGLLVLAWGLWHRLDAAYGLAVALLVVGIAASLLKGGDWEEALALGLVLAALVPARPHFYRKAVLAAEPIDLGWTVAILAVLGASVWLGLFAHKHVEYRDELWWRFALHADAPRFLRATVGSVGLLLALGLMRLFRYAPVAVSPPSEAELDRAAAVVARSSAPSAQLALVGDKALLFSESGHGLLMYGVSGRSWVALGDPIGEPRDREELAWRFRELADRHGGWTVFYEVGIDQLPLYIDLGLTLLKLGEQARVPLETFSLEGGSRKTLRRTLRAMEKEE